jgi:hypothetical protein
MNAVRFLHRLRTGTASLCGFTHIVEYEGSFAILTSVSESVTLGHNLAGNY